MDQIQHWRHKHPLFLRKDQEINNERCGMCNKEIVAPNDYYACDACEFYVHKSCAELPSHINHPFHPSHPLSLLSHWDYNCDSCHQNFWRALSFRCVQCNFDMDVECALISHITCEGREHIQHFLVEVDSKDNRITYCSICHPTASSGGFYRCIKCKRFLHKSCAVLPQKIQHPLHPNHSLLTLCVAREWFKCSLCHKEDRWTLTYNCDQCDLLLCVKCVMTVQATIRYEDHEHLLCLLEETYTKLARCDGYDAYCKQPATSTSTEIDHTQLSIL